MIDYSGAGGGLASSGIARGAPLSNHQSMSAEAFAEQRRCLQREFDKQKMKHDEILKSQKEIEVTTEGKDTVPDVSLTRVFKWAVVLIVAMFLGKKVWELFGDKVTKQLSKALGDVDAPAA
jgi:hypothetical protein